MFTEALYTPCKIFCQGRLPDLVGEKTGGAVKDDPVTGGTQVSFKELAYSNLVVVEVLVQLQQQPR